MDAIYSIGSVNSLSNLREVSGTLAGATGAVPSFGDVLGAALESVSKGQEVSNKLAMDFQSGVPNVSIEETMISLQKSSLDFQAAVQVRNKLVTAYNEIMNMQI